MSGSTTDTSRTTATAGWRSKLKVLALQSMRSTPPRVSSSGSTRSSIRRSSRP
ncbi:unnamed protein product [Symbiodinium necroappetens]|uniref:Uncharacterized protein n=1 Tax=Symbiodinium necroappetens TaxID=1628268 RepID=A0A812NKK1_9DINO|nr:unnamed protein product [Symbiodinium necroappetens]